MSLSAAGPARGLLLSALFALFLPAFAALAEAPVPSVPSAVPGQPHTYYPQGLPAQAAEPAPAASLLPPLSVTEHTLRLAGGDLRYTAKAGPLPLRDGKGETLAEIFYVAYMREPQDPKRPITFVFNGGPGAASAYLHLGAIGPKAIAASDKGEVLGPPPRLVDNDVELGSTSPTSFSSIRSAPATAASATAKSEKDFFGVEQDTEALADFIRLYLIDAGRMASPVFLAGESYGGFRAATITRACRRPAASRRAGLF